MNVLTIFKHWSIVIDIDDIQDNLLEGGGMVWCGATLVCGTLTVAALES